MAAHAAREEAALLYAASDERGTAAPFPPAPEEVDWEGELLSQWVTTSDTVRL